MIAEPERYVDEFRNAGADIITFHYAATRRAHWLLHYVREIGARAGLAINPQTPTAILVDLIGDCDQILVMSVEPGFGGQSFIEHSFEKVRQVRERREDADGRRFQSTKRCARRVPGRCNLSMFFTVPRLAGLS
jgi:ribulose-phosphate 3-epimerase